MNHRCLIVAPDTDLEFVKSEVMQVVNQLRAKILQGPEATLHGLLSILSEPFDIIWFATHGDENGVYLTGGLVSTSEITTMVRSVGASLVVFNTCSSRSVALTIYDELRIQFICTVKKLPDRTAFVTATIFARKVASGLSFREAYEAAKPGQNHTYLFLPEEREESMPQPERPPRQLDDDMHHLNNLVRRLEIIILGSNDYNVKGLAPTVREIVDKLNDVIEDVRIMKGNQQFNRRVLTGIAILSVIMLIAMLVFIYQRAI